MKVLVTGSNGYLGSSLTKKLLDFGHEVYGLSKLPMSIQHPNLHEVSCDLAEVKAVLLNEHFYAIFHVAARINFDESDDALEQLAFDNIIATQILAEFAVLSKTKIFVHSSSCSVYQENYNSKKWIDENYKLRPKNTYAVSKLASEWVLSKTLNHSGTNLITLRYSSIYGPGQRKGTILPIFIDKVINNEDIDIFGSGERIQDYVYIDDVVNANIRCLDAIVPYNTKLNIGSGDAITDRVLADTIVKNWESTSKVNILNKSALPNEYLNYNIEKAKQLIQFKPLSLAEGLREYKHVLEKI